VHEWALAEAVVESVIAKSLEIGRKRFEYLRVVLGRLQQIDKDILAYAIDQLLKLAREERGIEVGKVEFKEEEVELHCLRCGYRWIVDLGSMDESTRESIHFVPEAIHAYVKCPRCGSHDFEIAAGRGIAIELG